MLLRFRGEGPPGLCTFAWKGEVAPWAREGRRRTLKHPPSGRITHRLAGVSGHQPSLQRGGPLIPKHHHHRVPRISGTPQPFANLILTLHLYLPARRFTPPWSSEITQQHRIIRQRDLRVRLEELAQIPPRRGPLVDEPELAAAVLTAAALRCHESHRLRRAEE